MEEMPQTEARSIQDVSSKLKSFIEPEYEDMFWIRGVITDLNISRSNHTYFLLAEDNYSIECVLYDWKRRSLIFELDEGIEVDAYGMLRLYEPKCRLEFQIEQVQLIKRPHVSIDILVKEQMEKKGWLSKSPKPLPPVINRIAIITSRQSKVINDFKVLYEAHTRRTDVIKVIDVPLEGTNAPHQISDAIYRINRTKEADVIVLIRGGGNPSALATFNDLALAKAIHESSIPVVTGIGHQSDKTAADLVADYYAITPTAAANFLIREAVPEPAPLFQQTPVSRQKTSSIPTYLLLAIGLILALAALIFAISQFNQ